MNQIKTVTTSIENAVKERVGKYQHLLVAYSGGIDSSVLLHALMTLQKTQLTNLQLEAIYIHHGISQHADDWANHCKNQCDNWQIPIHIEKVKIETIKGNIEQQARDARYTAIKNHLKPNMALCTAQHLDDQSETFLLALKRGSGPLGLSGMPDELEFNGSRLLRPLLTISRADIEQYAHENQLSWVEDESNQDDRYDRNFLRLRVLPIMNQRWPHFNQMVARSAELCQEQLSLLDELLSDHLALLMDENKNLNFISLINDSPEKRNALLRMWLKSHSITMPSRKQLTLIWETVALAKQDSNPLFQLGDKQIRRYQDKLYLLPMLNDLTQFSTQWDPSYPLVLPDNLGSIIISDQQTNCRRPLKSEKVWVRFQAQGTFNVTSRAHSREIKKLWQEFAVPPWMRNRIPLIYYNQTLITAVGVFVTKEGAGQDIAFRLNLPTPQVIV